MKVTFEGTQETVLREMRRFVDAWPDDEQPTGEVPAAAKPACASTQDLRTFWDGLGNSRRFIATLVTSEPGFVLIAELSKKLGIKDMRGVTAGPATRWNFLFKSRGIEYPFALRDSADGSGYRLTQQLAEGFRAAIGDQLMKFASR